MVVDMSNWILSSVLEKSAKDFTDHTFLQIEDSEEETYGQCFENSLSVANGFQKQLNIKKGDHVVIMAPTSLEYMHCWFGLNILGAVEITINTAYKQDSLVYILNNSKAKIAIMSEECLELLVPIEGKLRFLEKVIPLTKNEYSPSKSSFFQNLEIVPFTDLQYESDRISQEIESGDPATIIYTSGTTGPAKGVVMPHGQTYLLAKNTVDGLRMNSNDIYYSFLPMFHMAGKFMIVYAAMIAGCKVVLDRSFQPAKWLSLVRKYKATIFGAHGPFLQMIYSEPEKPDDGENTLRAITTAPFPAKIAEDFERRFQVKGMEVWGITEINCPCYRPYDEPLRVGSCGKVVDEWYELKIVNHETGKEVQLGERGEIAVRAKYPGTVSLGYFEMPEKTAEAWRDGWFYSGDIAYKDKDGYVYFVDRLQERIRRRAENISSYDIESAVLLHPLVKECAAIGIESDFQSDDEVKIYVVMKDGKTLPPEKLIAYLLERIPHYMIPRYIEYVGELPRTPTGKIQKMALRKQNILEDSWDRKAANISLREITLSLKNKL